MSKKVFVIHGLGSMPNKAWRPWLMSELAKKDIFACSLPMPNSENPECGEWVEYLKNTIGEEKEIYLVGHSLGVRAVLRYLENVSTSPIKGAVLVSGRFGKPRSGILESFYKDELNFEKIKKASERFVVVHGDNDPNVPFEDGKMLASSLNCNLVVVPNGGHLSGKAGCFELPEVRDNLLSMIESN